MQGRPRSDRSPADRALRRGPRRAEQWSSCPVPACYWRADLLAIAAMLVTHRSPRALHAMGTSSSCRGSGDVPVLLRASPQFGFDLKLAQRSLKTPSPRPGGWAPVVQAGRPFEAGWSRPRPQPAMLARRTSPWAASRPHAAAPAPPPPPPAPTTAAPAASAARWRSHPLGHAHSPAPYQTLPPSGDAQAARRLPALRQRMSRRRAQRRQRGVSWLRSQAPAAAQQRSSSSSPSPPRRHRRRHRPCPTGGSTGRCSR